MIDTAQTPEAVAFNLLEKVMIAEGKRVSESTLKDILDMYAECLTATKDKRFPKS